MTSKQHLLQTLHFPRYAELPDLGLYMDQVISVMEKYLAPFTLDEEENLITSTMINNYVKQRLIPAPSKKRYGSDHLAQLFICTLLKQVLTLSELDCILSALRSEGCDLGAAYDSFCSELEIAIHTVFGGGEYAPKLYGDEAHILLHTACGAYAYQLRSRHLIRALYPEQDGKSEDKPEKSEKKKKSKKNAPEHNPGEEVEA